MLNRSLRAAPRSKRRTEPQSAKMLLFLQNGEQRVITFNLPKESCTLQEVLEQVKVPFSEDTHIQCLISENSEIDYYVSVGSTTRIEDMLENHPLNRSLRAAPRSKRRTEPQSAKMLLFLQNGEQRVITFNLPKESCTLQEVLEQVKVPFSEDTHIQCLISENSEIDYYVSVGSTTSIEDMLENHPLNRSLRAAPRSKRRTEPQSAKMLLFLQNGEQRVITFNLPKESCTLQEVLEQVKVPFSEDTHIQCLISENSEIDYYVSVGSTTSIEDMLENHPLGRHSSEDFAALAGPSPFQSAPSTSRAKSPEIDSSVNQSPGVEPEGDCIICFEKKVDSALYSCGHSCMCFECAKDLWRGKGDGKCPMCRQFIKDVIKLYKSV